MGWHGVSGWTEHRRDTPTRKLSPERLSGYISAQGEQPMATTISDDAPPSAKEIRLVIAASSLGTIFEWYDFFIYGTLAASGIIGRTFFPARQRDGADAARLGGLRGRLRLPAARRGAVRLSRRQAGAQIYLPRHHHADGPRHRRGRAGARRRRRSGLPRRSIVIAAAHRCRGWRWAANMAARRSMSPSIRRQGKRGFYTSFIQASVVGGFILSLIVVLADQGADVRTRHGTAWGWRVPVRLLAAAARRYRCGCG